MPLPSVLSYFQDLRILTGMEPSTTNSTWRTVQEVRAELGHRHSLRHPSANWTRAPEAALEAHVGDGWPELA